MIFNEYLIKTASMVVKSDSKYLFVAVWRFKMIFFERNSRSTLVQVDLWSRYKFTRTRKKFLVKIGKNWTAVELETCIRCLSVIILFLRTRMWKNHSMSWSRVMWIRLYRLQVRTVPLKPNFETRSKIFECWPWKCCLISFWFVRFNFRRSWMFQNYGELVCLITTACFSKRDYEIQI